MTLPGPQVSLEVQEAVAGPSQLCRPPPSLVIIRHGGWGRATGHHRRLGLTALRSGTKSRATGVRRSPRWGPEVLPRVRDTLRHTAGTPLRWRA